VKRSPQFYCTAKKTDGTICQAYAIRGSNVCRVHGGSAPAVKAAAERNVELEAARRQLAALGEPEDIDPGQALLRLIAWKYGEVQWLRDQVRTMPASELAWGKTQEDKGIGPQGVVDMTTTKAAPSVWWTLLRQSEDQLADYSTRALKAGIAERQIRLAEGQGDLVAGVVRRIFERLNLTPGQLAIKDVIAREEFLRLSETQVIA
jgi:hypothetical protein